MYESPTIQTERDTSKSRIWGYDGWRSERHSQAPQKPFGRGCGCTVSRSCIVVGSHNSKQIIVPIESPLVADVYCRHPAQEPPPIPNSSESLCGTNAIDPDELRGAPSVAPLDCASPTWLPTNRTATVVMRIRFR